MQKATRLGHFLQPNKANADQILLISMKYKYFLYVLCNLVIYVNRR